MDHRRAEWIDRTDALELALGGVGAGPLALDTEADSLHHYPEKVCLIQLSFAGRDYLVDVLSDISLDPLAERLADRSILKILHGADYDLRMLHRGFGMTFESLFDTMIAARLAGETRFGLAHLLEQYFEIPVDKKFQRADWSVRPLTPEMAHYAAMDTRYLIPLWERLRGRLEELGRVDWAAEEFERLEQIRAAPPGPSDEGFRRVKGAGRLAPQKLAVLRELWSLREARAVKRDRPPFRILHDARLIELCELLPRCFADLEKVSGLPRPWCHGGRARELLAAVRRGLDAEPPAPARRPGRGRGRPPAKSADERVTRIKKHRDQVAHELGLEPALLGPRAVLEQMAERLETGGDAAKTPDLRRWQWKLLAPATEEPQG